MERNPTHTLTRLIAASASASLIALAGGCYSSTPTGANDAEDEPAERVAGVEADTEGAGDAVAENTGVSAEDIERSRRMLEQAFANLDAQNDPGSMPAGFVPLSDPASPIALERDPTMGASVEAATESPEDPADTSEAVADAGVSETDASWTLEELVAQAAEMLATRAMTSEDPAGDAMALAALEAALPGLAARYLDSDADSGGSLGLSPGELRTVRAVRDAMEVVQSGRAEPGLAAERLRELASALESAEPVRIRHAALCTRVMGYGQYEPFPGTTFAAGRAQPMLVYVELDRFAHRDLGSAPAGRAADGSPLLVSASQVGSRYEVEVAMTLELFLMSSSGVSASQPEALLVQRRPRAIDKRQGRNRLRDYYLLTRLDLPPTLRAGRYHLKVTVEDLVGGGVTEEILPIDLVADASLATGSAG